MKPSDQNILLKVEGLRVVFRQNNGQHLTAVNDISFTLHRGQTLGVLGESGSGKSVTALSILQLLPSDIQVQNQGQFFFYDQNHQQIALHKLSEKQLNRYRGNRIAMIFQEPKSALNPVFKVGHQIMEAVLLHTNLNKKAAKTKTIEWLEKVQLTETERIFNAYPHQLSGGQLQRIMIAMAMSCQPDLLIADEPTTGLDVTVQKEILQLMRDLQKETNCAIFFISHDLGVIHEIANEVIVMQKGTIVERGAVKAVFQQPKHPYTKGLIACRPPLDKRLKRLPTIEDFTQEQSKEAAHPHFATEPINKIAGKHTPLLAVRHLKVEYITKRNLLGQPKKTKIAVNEVDFKIFQGETIGLIGESGSGKTTVGKAILRLIPTQNGSIQYRDTEISDYKESALKNWRKKAQIIFQDPYASLNPNRRIGDAIIEVLQVHQIVSKKQQYQKTIELLQDVGLDASHYDRFPRQLSGGQRQRVCIARALALHPEFIVCDEPVSALDVSVQAQVLNLLKDLRDKYRFTYLFISHDFSVIRFMCDRLLVMKDGNIIESGYTDEVLNNPKEAFTKRLLGAVV